MYPILTNISIYSESEAVVPRGEKIVGVPTLVAGELLQENGQSGAEDRQADEGGVCECYTGPRS